MARRQPYEHAQIPSDAPTEPDTKIWLDKLNQPQVEELEVHLDDDPAVVSDEPPKAREDPEPIRAKPDPEPEPEPIKAVERPKPSADDEAYLRLKAQLDREKQAREYAQKRTQELEAQHVSTQERLRQEQERQVSLQREHLEAQEIAIDNAISYAESQAAQAQREISRALNEGDYDSVASAHRTLAKAEGDLSRLRDGKSAIEVQKKTPVERHDPVTSPQPQAPQSTYERIEQYITQPAHSLRAQQYMRDHYSDLFSDFEGGANRLSKLVGGHWLAKADGVVENSDSYFDYLDKHMGYKEAEPVATPQVKTPPPVSTKTSKAIPPSAPVSRGQSSENGSGTSITLSRAEVEFCNASGIKPADYARNKLIAMKGGSDPNYSGPRFTNDR